MFEEALADYGYLVLFIGSGIEGDAALGTAAFLAQQGKLNPVWTFLVAIAGSALASEISFRLGRNRGAAWVGKQGAGNPKLDRIRSWVAGRSNLLVFGSRFLWGFRLTIPALCGASGMTPRVFSAWNLAGALVWGTVVGAGAFFFGVALERLWDDYSEQLPLIAGGLFAFLLAVYFWGRRDKIAGSAVLKAVEDKLETGEERSTREYVVDCSLVGERPSYPVSEAALRGSYAFTPGKDWFSQNAPTWTAMMAPWAGRPGVRYLEIGSAEGRSMVWMLENVLTHPTARAVSIDPFAFGMDLVELDGETLGRFHANLRLSGMEERVTPIQGPSEIELRKLPVDERFDLIYVDGNHRATGVLEDLVLSWRLLEPGGLLIADDYGWKPEWELSERPMMAIDFFIRVFEEELEVVHRHYQVMLRKASAEALAALPSP